MTTDVGTQLRRGVVEYCVLGLVAEAPKYGWELSEALVAHNLIASIGTLYPLLARLRDRGWIEAFHEHSTSGPTRKYYRLTTLGAEHLQAFRAQWAPFTRTVDTIITGGAS
ncbi:PadR family transcriptional regulator [Leucobacter sp. Psy1]|uniref:PadR family transcriptional regulator n=1 Tax=Leucobacter sp. Psy1 TaxID=2875729 RepID=UPI001CD568A7|nr:PadR family transcriptional regulator [Leucobacter sp. Psy1]UBH05251.1 PadR family transcriptional regulator [Leucobacter sp. Psy1]